MRYFMERIVPKTSSEEIQLYMRTYYSLLRSSHAFQIETLVESHIGMQSSLHLGANEVAPDISALLYSALRLPACMTHVQNVAIGQLEKSFVMAGYKDIHAWQRVFSPGRRRRMQYNQQDILAVYIVSRSDIDDLVPILTAYQIEWNKLNLLLQHPDTRTLIEASAGRSTTITKKEMELLAEVLRVSVKDIQRLEILWQDKFWDTLLLISNQRKDISLRMVNGSLADYRRATASWWEELKDTVAKEDVDPETTPIYFVSSNTHALVNLLTGFASRYEENLIEHMKQQNHSSLLAEYESIQSSANKNLENFLYFVLGKYIATDDAKARLRVEEKSVGIYRVPNKHGFEIEAQIMVLKRLKPEWFDSRIGTTYALENSDAIILNIDYPLGMAAYEILSRINERNDFIQGMYIIGKAATLNARVGDVMLPQVVHDEHSQNTYLFNNCFSAQDVRPYMHFGNVLDNQKAVTALGTFLQNPKYMSVFYREGYTDIEMEAGPYLSATYEAFRPRRHPENEIVNLYGVPFDIGFLHYASDTPMKHGQNLGSGSLAMAGVESTYATAIAVVRRILAQEVKRLTLG
jgi:hypothetical protein